MDGIACVLQHIRCEPPGLFTGMLADRGFGVETIELDEGDGLPDWREVDLVLAMGGPMGAYDETAHPWLVTEKEWIAAAVRAGTPYLGVCLGAQLLAASLGAEVCTGATPEVGVLPVEATGPGRADPVFGGLGGRFPALQWHGDTFAIPSGGRRPIRTRRSGSVRRRTRSSSTSRSPTRCWPNGGTCPHTRRRPRLCWVPAASSTWPRPSRPPGIRWRGQPKRCSPRGSILRPAGRRAGGA
jgi:GMP synthase-like glutamine amidotransferase